MSLTIHLFLLEHVVQNAQDLKYSHAPAHRIQALETVSDESQDVCPCMSLATKKGSERERDE